MPTLIIANKSDKREHIVSGIKNFEREDHGGCITHELESFEEFEAHFTNKIAVRNHLFVIPYEDILACDVSFLQEHNIDLIRLEEYSVKELEWTVHAKARHKETGVMYTIQSVGFHIVFTPHPETTEPPGYQTVLRVLKTQADKDFEIVDVKATDTSMFFNTEKEYTRVKGERNPDAIYRVVVCKGTDDTNVRLATEEGSDVWEGPRTDALGIFIKRVVEDIQEPYFSKDKMYVLRLSTAVMEEKQGWVYKVTDSPEGLVELTETQGRDAWSGLIGSGEHRFEEIT